MTARLSILLSASVLASTTLSGPTGAPPAADAAKNRQPLSSVCRMPGFINQRWQPVPASVQRPNCMKHP
jgi:hypothetical protein